MIDEAALVSDVSLLRNPVNLDELNALIGEVLKRPIAMKISNERMPQPNAKKSFGFLRPSARGD